MLDATNRAGVIERALVGDDTIKFARAVLGALADHGRGLAADFARGRLPLAKLTHVRHRRCRSRHGFRGSHLRQLFRFWRLLPWQQHEHQPEPKCHPLYKMLLPPPTVSFVLVALISQSAP